jgi:hypothetical protein
VFGGELIEQNLDLVKILVESIHALFEARYR